MDAIVLAGGRGRRMGALTLRRQKGSLSYGGEPIICRIIAGLLAQRRFTRILVAAGYRPSDVCESVKQEYGDLLRQRVIEIQDFQVQGSLVRLAHALRYFEVQDRCFACGIDVIVPTSVTRDLLRSIDARISAQVVMPVSPRTYIAPSHPRMRVHNSIVTDYCPNPLTHPPPGDGWMCSLGIRYLSGAAFEEIRSFDGENVGFLSFAKRWQASGRAINAYVFEDEWQHFGVPSDFVRAA